MTGTRKSSAQEQPEVRKMETQMFKQDDQTNYVIYGNETISEIIWSRQDLLNEFEELSKIDDGYPTESQFNYYNALNEAILDKLSGEEHDLELENIAEFEKTINEFFQN